MPYCVSSPKALIMALLFASSFHQHLNNLIFYHSSGNIIVNFYPIINGFISHFSGNTGVRAQRPNEGHLCCMEIP